MADNNQPKPLKPEDILKNYKTLKPEQITLAFNTPELTPSILSVVTKFNENQLRTAVPLLTTDQIRTLTPKLQLQQAGAIVQIMEPNQVRQLVKSLTKEDRLLLMQNITLLTSSTNKDELQSFISFVDPLAMAIAVQIKDLTERIIEACGVMTVEQLRVVVPLVSLENIKSIVSTLEHDSQIETAILMIDATQKEELTRSYINSITEYEKKKEEFSTRLEHIKKQFPDITTKINSLPQVNDNKEREYESIVRIIKTTKTDIEQLQQQIREEQASLKLPKLIMSSPDFSEQLSKLTNYGNDLSSFGKEAHAQFSLLTGNDGLTTHLNRQWQQIKSSSGSGEATEKQDSKDGAASADPAEDDNFATDLYDAIREIGNPDAVGNHYSMTWDQIIKCGFRSSQDFKDKKIATLEQLQEFINSSSR